MQHFIDSWLSEKLEERKVKNLLRSLPKQNGGIDFTSNDYLGLAQSEKLHQTIQEKIRSFPKINGSTGSRLLSGNSGYTEHLEEKLAEIFNSKAALIFNSGYSANLAVLSSIPQKGDTIIYDELAHACIKDGARLSLARRFSFRHNDCADLEQKIKHGQGRIFIAVESIYSMDGDESPLKDLIEISEKHGATIILDEAHSTGVCGKNGNGLAASLGLENRIAVRIYTFGKAMGIHGACVAGSHSLIQYLVNFARPFIYTTALPLHSVVSISCAFDFLKDNIHLQSLLKSKIDTFIKTSVHTYRIMNKSAIQTLIVPGNNRVKDAAIALQNKGFDVRPILSPTVRENTERLRICIHAFNNDQDIIELAKELSFQKVNSNG